MEFHSENHPHPWHYVALGALLLVVGLLAAAVLVVGRNYTPGAFAEARTLDALRAEVVAHTEAMNELAEVDRASAVAHAAERRRFWTWGVFGAAAALAGLAGLAVLSVGSAAVSWSFRVSVANLAVAAQTWREVRGQPVPVFLPNGLTALPPGFGGYVLLDERTGQVGPIGEGLPVSEARVHLEQAGLASRAVESLAVGGEREGALAWLWRQVRSPLPHKGEGGLVFGRMGGDHNQKTKG